MPRHGIHSHGSAQVDPAGLNAREKTIHIIGGWRLYCTIASARNYVATVEGETMDEQWRVGGFHVAQPRGVLYRFTPCTHSTVDLCTEYSLAAGTGFFYFVHTVHFVFRQ